MDYRGRKNRRGRDGVSHANTTPIHAFIPPSKKPWCFLNNLYSFLIIISTIAIIYVIWEHHCSYCYKTSNLNNISKSVDDISINLSQIKNQYYDLETKISKFSQDLPKIEDQIEILEGLANTVRSNNFVYDSKFPSISKKDVICHMPFKEVVQNVSIDQLSRD